MSNIDVSWFRPDSRFSEKHYGRTTYNNSKKESHFVKLKDAKEKTTHKINFDMEELVYDNGDNRRCLNYTNWTVHRNRSDLSSDIIKINEFKNGKRTITTNYAANKNYSIGVLKEQQKDGSWIAKIYQKNSRGSEFDRAFYFNKLIFDSSKKYSREQINALLSKSYLPQKAINIIKKVFR